MMPWANDIFSLSMEGTLSWLENSRRVSWGFLQVIMQYGPFDCVKRAVLHGCLCRFAMQNDRFCKIVTVRSLRGVCSLVSHSVPRGSLLAATRQ